MYNISQDVTMLQLNLSRWDKPKRSYSSISMEKQSMLPRLLWVRKDMTMKELHFEVFKTLRQVFSEWVSLADENSTRQLKPEQEAVRKNIIEFPFRLQEDQPMTQEQFDALSDEDAF